jgi:hypothetical protein
MGNDARSFAVVVGNESKLLKDDGSRLPRKVMGRNGPDQWNNNDGRCWMGGGMTQRALQIRKQQALVAAGPGQQSSWITTQRGAMQ